MARDFVKQPEPVIEEIAKAIFEVSSQKVSEAMGPIYEPEPYPPQMWDEITEREQELHREYARAAIRALPIALGL